MANLTHKTSIVASMRPSQRRFLRMLRRLPSLLASSLYDLKRYAFNSAFLGIEGRIEAQRGVITATYHNIEKGLSLPNPRPGFGVGVAEKLVGLIHQYLNSFGPDGFIVLPISVLERYLSFQEDHDIRLPKLVAEVLAFRKIAPHPTSAICAGTIQISSDYVRAGTVGVSLDFFTRRHSVRQFKQERLPDADIAFAITAAQKAPGVCNRQSGRIRRISGADRILKTLDIQGGARGFAENVPDLFCISVEVSNFNGVGERYQPWIDGGLFAMSFIMGLHARGIGSCCLNWSKDRTVDQIMRNHLQLPNSEMIIMFIAAGPLLDEFSVAASNRRPAREIYLEANG